MMLAESHTTGLSHYGRVTEKREGELEYHQEGLLLGIIQALRNKGMDYFRNKLTAR
jgi:hypothetical protein